MSFGGAAVACSFLSMLPEAAIVEVCDATMFNHSYTAGNKIKDTTSNGWQKCKR